MVDEPHEDLGRFRYHTGATLRPPLPDERYPALFRDLGSVAAARYLRGELPRLAGPQTPLLYLRTRAYVEPYVDYEDIGRLVFLRPAEIAPWHAGLAEVYVARATCAIAADAVSYVPTGATLAKVAALAAEVRDAAELREALGGRLHDEARAETLRRLELLNVDLEATEALAEPLRCASQSSDEAVRTAAREELARLAITESELCTTWHHLPRGRRDHVRAQLARVTPAGKAAWNSPRRGPTGGRGFGGAR